MLLNTQQPYLSSTSPPFSLYYGKTLLERGNFTLTIRWSWSSTTRSVLNCVRRSASGNQSCPASSCVVPRWLHFHSRRNSQFNEYLGGIGVTFNLETVRIWFTKDEIGICKFAQWTSITPVYLKRRRGECKKIANWKPIALFAIDVETDQRRTVRERSGRSWRKLFTRDELAVLCCENYLAVNLRSILQWCSPDLTENSLGGM